jgi:arylsulfatase A-like enzyme/thioredoxin-like negative regulator of GroEL
MSNTKLRKITTFTKTKNIDRRDLRGLRELRVWLTVSLLCAITASCSAPPPPARSSPQPRHLILITIDTLRADRVGAYGYAAARTPHLDGLARRGALFTHAYATAPITLPSHASLMTSRYPPGHGARHNGMRVDPKVTTLADVLSSAGFATGAFVAAFPLDRRFGLNKGFGSYGDRMPRGARGQPANERPGRDVVDEAVAWLGSHRSGRTFLWVHLFEPHAPYGDPRSSRPATDRYDDEVAEADSQVGRLLEALQSDASASLIVVASDHGEAFGEHGEISHSIFVYDTTLRVALVMAGPGIAPRAISSAVSLVDVAPTVLKLLGVKTIDADGIDLSPALGGAELAARDLYAESFAPLLDFGWSPLRALRADGFKYIEAPRPELYDTSRDSAEMNDVSKSDAKRAGDLRERVQRYSPATLDVKDVDREALRRLQALGYVSGGGRGRTDDRPDPKDRRELAARIAHVTSGELEGAPLEAELRAILREDPRNPQANLRLGYVLLESNRCPAAMPFLKGAIDAHVPTADAHLGLALCQAAARHLADAQATLTAAQRLEPDNPVVLANLGILLSDAGRHAEAIAPLQRALTIDPDFHEARFNLARVFARSGQRESAAREASELLKRLPADAPQRAEVVRLLKAVQ